MPGAIQREEFWRDEFTITPEDENALQEYFLQQGRPIGTDELAHLFMEWQLSGGIGGTTSGDTYTPNGRYEVGDRLRFPSLNNTTGEVIGLRPGQNERYGDFRVIEVQLAGQEASHEFATELSTNALVLGGGADEPALGLDELYERYGHYVREEVLAALEASDNFVFFAERWLPRVMLVTFHEGHCNIAEAMIDITGEALPPGDLLTEIPLEEEASEEVKHFSLNLTLSQDARFVNMGTDVKPLWHLQRLV